MPATTVVAVVDVELADGEVIEEEQRLGALHDEVVDAHGDQIDADGGVAPGVDGDAQLGADAVVGGDQDRIAVARRLQVEQAAEAAEAAVRAQAAGRLDERLDGLDERVAGVDVDPGVAVGDAGLRSRSGSVIYLGIQRFLCLREMAAS